MRHEPRQSWRFPHGAWNGWRVASVTLGVLALAGLAVRLWPFWNGGSLVYPVDYDEGVYFAAAGLLFRGVLPYRDFVFVHPPGLLLVLGGTAAWRADPAALLAASRWVAAGFGAVSVALAGRSAQRAAGPLGGAVAAALYALFPQAVAVERGPFLEPVLNLLCLSLALVWLGGEAPSARRSFWAGVLGGAALAVKVWAGAWLVAALVTLPGPRKGRTALAAVLGGAAALAVLVAPFALQAPGELVTQTLRFHTWRPPDGPAGFERFKAIFGLGHRACSLLAAVGLLDAARRLRDPAARAGRFFATAYLLTLAGFALSSSYWGQYNAHLAASETVLAGLGAGALWSAFQGRARALRAVGLVALALALRRPWREVREGARHREPQPLALADFVRAQVPREACLFAMEPAWGLIAGRWPEAPPGGRVVVDTYAAELLAATEGGARYATVYDAFAAERAQAPLRPLLEACPFVITGWRGTWQLSASSKDALESRSVLAFPPPGGEGIQLWRRR